MNRVKVLFTIPNFDTPGSGRALLKLAERMDRSSFEPHICCLHDRGSLFREVKASGVPIHLQSFTSPMRPVLDGLRACWQVSRFFRQFDLIHSFHYSDDYSEAIAARMAGAKWVYVKKNMSWGSRAWRLRTRLAHGVVAQNSDMMRLFFEHNDKVRLIPIGVDTEEFRSRPPAGHLSAELDLMPDDRVVLAVANLVPVKGIEHLLDAFDAVSQKYPKARLVIVGDDRSPYANELKNRAAGLRSAGHITFTGPRNDVADFHSIASLFVLPSLGVGEGGPISVLEAMASGTLTLASDVAGIRDQLAHEPRQLFEAGNVASLAAKMDWALSLPSNEVQVLLEKQTDVIQRQYRLDESVARHEAFYRVIAGAE
jgi:glycosyltransferase involved in cell wall biosynthesis